MGAGAPGVDGTRGVVLVDHNERKQVVDEYDMSLEPNRKRLKGVIDHHAIGENFFTEKPVMRGCVCAFCMCKVSQSVSVRLCVSMCASLSVVVY